MGETTANGGPGASSSEQRGWTGVMDPVWRGGFDTTCGARVVVVRATNDDACRHDVCRLPSRRLDARLRLRRTSNVEWRSPRSPPPADAQRRCGTPRGNRLRIPSVAPGARGNGSLTGATRDAAHGRARMGPARPPPNHPMRLPRKPHPRRARRNLILSLVSISHGTKKHPLKDDFQGILLIYTQCFSEKWSE